MAKTIPVVYRDGVLVPQVELEDFVFSSSFRNC
jgi:hypothetical protein